MTEDGTGAVPGSGKAVTGFLGGQEWVNCRYCARLFLRRRRDQLYCSARCSNRGYNASHPVKRLPEQGDLFGGGQESERNLPAFDAKKLARPTDPETSHAAADSCRELRARHHEIILAALGEHGPLTSEEVASLTDLTHPQTWRRMGELRERGLLLETECRRPNSSGRLAVVWALAGGGR